MRVLFICLLFSCLPILSQNGKITVNQSSKLDSIIKLKKELNSKVQKLRIQIFNGDRENAELVMKEYLEIFNDTSANIIYETPNYKIWVGNFYNQLEADKRLIGIRKKFKPLNTVLATNPTKSPNVPPPIAIITDFLFISFLINFP